MTSYEASPNKYRGNDDTQAARGSCKGSRDRPARTTANRQTATN